MEAQQSTGDDSDLLDNLNTTDAEQESNTELGYTYRDPVEQTHVEVD